MISLATYIFFTPKLIVTVSEMATVTLGTVSSLHVMFANLRLKKQTDLL